MIKDTELMNKICDVSFPVAIIITLLCRSILTAQTRPVPQQPNKSTHDFVVKAEGEITRRFGEIRQKEELNLHVKQAALSEAQQSMTKAETARFAAQAALSDRVKEVEAAQLRVKQLQVSTPSQEQLKTALNVLRSAEEAKNTAQLTLSDRTSDIELGRANVLMAEVEVNKAAEEASINNEIRTIQIRILETLTTRWLANPTESNLIGLTDQITSLSCAGGVYADPLWTSTPNAGALIFYQTQGERSRNEKPHRLADLSNSRQKVCQGSYYVWAERIIGGQQRSTSDKNATIDIALDTPKVTVVESH
jgi:hypothetical protein